eukprot:GGOE01005449.1.p1 GENE.GGOE01005449.1~~GGOE01005449.1.p1  ORF type:complete len:546 (-),score=112.50 GGOE01005449.1:365-2002(-)
MNAVLAGVIVGLVLALVTHFRWSHRAANAPAVAATHQGGAPVHPRDAQLRGPVHKAPLNASPSTTPPPHQQPEADHAARLCLECREAFTGTASTPVPCNLTAAIQSMQAKEALLRTVSIDDPVLFYELQDRIYFSPWGDSTITLLGALWAPSLPFLELLVFHRFRRMMIRLAQCISVRPLAAPVLTLPSGSQVVCHAWWPSHRDMARRMRPISQRGGVVIVTSVRYLCPLSPCHATCLASLPTFSLSLTVPNSNATDTITFIMHRRQRPFVLVTACTQPLWGYSRMKQMYPTLLDEWLAYLRFKGFGDVQVYELWRDTMAADLDVWRRTSAFVAFFPGWGSGKWDRDSRKFIYCTQSAAHDHCLFTNQLHARWAMIVHGPDLYPHGGNTTPVTAALAPFDHRRVNTLRISRQNCGGERASGQLPLLLSFNACATPEAGSSTPFFNPLRVLATFVHGPLVSLPITDTYDEVDVDASHTVSVHFYDAFKTWNSARKGQLFEDNLRPKHQPSFHSHTTIGQVYPEVHRMVQLVRNLTPLEAQTTARSP